MTHQPGVYVPLRALFLVSKVCFWSLHHFEQKQLKLPAEAIVINAISVSDCCFVSDPRISNGK